MHTLSKQCPISDLQRKVFSLCELRFHFPPFPDKFLPSYFLEITLEKEKPNLRNPCVYWVCGIWHYYTVRGHEPLGA